MDRLTRLVRMLKGMIVVTPVKETRLLKLHVMSSSPEMATKVANAVAKAYISFNINNRLKSSQTTLSWLTDHLYEMKKKLEDAEEAFLAYKQDAKLISVKDSQQIIAQKIRDFNDAYIKARNRRLELSAKLAKLEHVRYAWIQARMITTDTEYVKIYTENTLQFKLSMYGNFRLNTREL